ncbi:type II toxin-antitoxin system VapC family toxin [bacterium]|nr:type II toxin-antitoxin system VapC family toxin [bacterium]MBU1616078.1 type II toxin-antitoxin system VapC family toxin [bacterium]
MPGKGGQIRQVLYDTSIIISYLRGKPDCKANMEAVRTGKIVGFVSSVTVFELYVGAFCAPNTSESLRDVREIISWFQPPLSFDDSIAQKCAYLFAQLRKSNELIELRDLFIAATAIMFGLPICTLNRDHFKRVPTLKLTD